MNKQTRTIIFAVALIAILIVATGSAAAKATKTDFSYTLFTCTLDTPDEEWWTGGTPDDPAVYHWRGQNSFGFCVSTDENVPWFNGTVPGRSSADVKLPSFTGNVHGTFTKHFDNEKKGTFEGTWVGKFTDGVLSFKAVAHGTGDLARMKYFVDLVQVFGDDIPDGDDPCPGVAAGVYAASAVLLELPCE